MQSKHGELLQSKNGPEKQLVNIESWHKEKAQDGLKEICPDIFVYACKQDNKPEHPSHWLCANCYNNKEKSVLQLNDCFSDGTYYGCPSCKEKIRDYSKKDTSLNNYNPQGGSGPNSWMDV